MLKKDYEIYSKLKSEKERCATKSTELVKVMEYDKAAMVEVAGQLDVIGRQVNELEEQVQTLKSKQ